MESRAIQEAAEETTENTAPASLARILVALDASDHANRALEEAVRLAKSADGVITGIHAYAAALHHRRRQLLEGARQELYRAEHALG